MSKGSKIVTDAILGMDSKTVVVNDKVYFIPSPTIYRLAGAGKYLSGFGEEKTISDIFRSVHDSMNLCKALSWLICGSVKLAHELGQGTLEEIVNALEEAYSLLSVENFTKLSALARNVAGLIAKAE